MLTVSSNTFQKVLEAKRNELLLGTSDRDEIRIENAAEDFDRIQQRMNREVAIRNFDRESRLLKSVEEALARIETGDFGVCLRCDETIPEKRLKAVPWASHCLSCQEKLDRRRAMGELEDDSDLLQSAA
jgi:RNA polymerase-binding transcription factor